MKNKIFIAILVILIIVAGYLVYRWARFSQLPEGNPNERPLEISN